MSNKPTTHYILYYDDLLSMNIVMILKTILYRLILSTVNKSYTNKYIRLTINKPTTTSVWEKEIDD